MVLVIAVFLIVLAATRKRVSKDALYLAEAHKELLRSQRTLIESFLFLVVIFPLLFKSLSWKLSGYFTNISVQFWIEVAWVVIALILIMATQVKFYWMFPSIKGVFLQKIYCLNLTISFVFGYFLLSLLFGALVANNALLILKESILLFLSNPQSIYYVVYRCLAVPFLEELIYRGFLYVYLRSFCGIILSSALTSAIMMFSHRFETNDLIASIFFLSVSSCLIFEISGSLVPSTLLHGLHNLIVYLLDAFFLITPNFAIYLNALSFLLCIFLVLLIYVNQISKRSFLYIALHTNGQTGTVLAHRIYKWRSGYEEK